MNKATGYKYGLLMIVLAVLTGCRKDLCYGHFNEVDLQLEVVYSLDWHLPWEVDWNENWPEDWEVDWEMIRPRTPESVRLHTFDADSEAALSSHNLASNGGRVTLNSGRYHLLLYNSDTEGVLFEDMHAVHQASATTRARTRSAYSTRYPDEVTVSTPDDLFATFMPEYELKQPASGESLHQRINAELTPRTWTYLIRYEFSSGQEFVTEAQAYLSGMAGRVCLKDGYTDEEHVVTLLLDCAPSDYGVETVTRSFGLPGFDYPMVKEGRMDDAEALSRVAGTNRLLLEMKLRSGKIKVVEFDVTPQVRSQPRGGVIVVKDIIVTPEEGQGSDGSGFDGEVSDWEENIDVDIPIT